VATDAAKLALTVATPLGLQLQLDVESVQLPGVAGEFGVLPEHTPLLAALRPGVVRYKHDGALLVAALGAGFAEAGAAHVRVISEFFVRPEDVKIEEARADWAKADQTLKTAQSTLGEPEQLAAQRDLDWAQARIEIASSVH
jgi:F-type H+-transporting ATPase subunit epsilon